MLIVAVGLLDGVENKMDVEQLKEICSLTVRLTELRQKECGHLAIENFAPELFAKLIGEFSMAESGTYRISGEITPIFRPHDAK